MSCVFYIPSPKVRDIKHATHFINTIWNENSFQILYVHKRPKGPHIVHPSTICHHFCLPDRPKNTKLVEDVEILLPVKFRWIPFSGFRGEIKNISANQRPGRPSCFSDQHKKHKLGRGRWDYASSQVSLNSVQQFQRRSQKCLSQSETWAAILFFRSAWKTQTW